MTEWDCLPQAAKAGVVAYYVITALGILLWISKILLAYLWSAGEWWERLRQAAIALATISILSWAAINIGLALWSTR